MSRLSAQPEEKTVDAIARNLEVVLNAKKGYAGAVEVFGLGSYDAHFWDKQGLEALTSEMLDQVRRHEPRLREPRLVARGRTQGLWMCFSLSGRVAEETRSFAVLFHSVLLNVRVAFEAR